MAKRILHISDLHINDPRSTSENLRLSRYKEFIDDLYESYANSYAERDRDVDLLFVTGDFIDRGKVENFPHAESVVDYIVNKFKVPKGHTFVCLGNHDLIRAEDKAGNIKKAIEDYVKFEKKYNESVYTSTKLGERASIFKVIDDYILIFDPVSDTKGNDKPATGITDEFIDKISGEWVKDKIPAEANLYILSHYPLIQSKKELLDYEEADWSGRHIWKDGYPIKERIAKIRGKCEGKTIWFFGDAHLPDFVKEEKSPSIAYLMTGQFGGNYDTAGVTRTGNSYRPYHQATSLTLEDSTLKRIVFSYEPKGFKFSVHLGEWTGAESSILFDIPTSSTSHIKEEKSAFIVPVGSSIEDEIYEEVKNEELYRFGKFVTSEKNVALGWISINSLFKNTLLLSNGIDKIIEWLNKTILVGNEQEFFIGCGFWGGILASNVSVRTGVNTFAISSFVSTPNSCPYDESIEHLVANLTNLDKIKRIIIFTDVISSGDTLFAVKTKFENLAVKKFEWSAVSILIDSNNISDDFRNNFKISGSLCTKLKMPVIKRNLLPSDDLYPPRLDLTV